MSVNEKRCPYCGAWQPGLFGYGPALQRILGGRLDLTQSITIACVALYVISLAIDPAAILHMAGIFDLLAPSGQALFRLGMTGGYAIALGQWWTLCTAVFLHGSALHILFNLVIMRRYLPMVAELYGNVRAFVIFMVAGVMGYVLSTLLGAHNTIGASGAIFGLLGALISYGRRTGQSQVTGQLWTSAILMFAMSFFMSANVNNWAHAGGFAGGWVTAEFMRSSEEKRESPLVQVLALVLLAATAVGIPLSFVRVTSLMFAR